MLEDIRHRYESRLNLLDAVSHNLDRETQDALRGLPHIDRISFRTKVTNSFVTKATDPKNDPPYRDPLVEIEDQIAGRVIVFFIHDIDAVLERLNETFTTVESTYRKPPRDAEFGYESHHLICIIPPQSLPEEWNARDDLPNTFELQIRTIFMHAYSEPQHDLAYKAQSDLPNDIRKELAWIAASAWGADRAYDRVWQWHLISGSGHTS